MSVTNIYDIEINADNNTAVFLGQAVTLDYLAHFILPSLIEQNWSVSALVASMERAGVPSRYPVWRHPQIQRFLIERLEAQQKAEQEAREYEERRRAMFPTPEELKEDQRKRAERKAKAEKVAAEVRKQRASSGQRRELPEGLNILAL
ncbi:hypothetical protein [Aeromonas sp. R1-2]|uniref:hypothetical protein n=1 Tax=Aeromonas sp. R1-2 TaxID=3138456 RepID=UPI0034A533E6